MKKELYLMRHGETLFNQLKKIQGWCDSPLSKDGIKQAEAAKDALKGIQFDHYYSSTSERASDTLEIIVGEQPYQRLKGIKEINFGLFEGESEQLNPKTPTDYENFFVAYGGESAEQVVNRMVDTLTQVMEQDDHHRVLAVSHGGSMFRFSTKWMDVEKMIGTKIKNCTIFKFEYENQTFKLVDVIEPVFG